MTTYYNFIPSNTKAPSFMPTFDGNIYNVTIIWNISARRYYVKCQDLNNVVVFLVPLIESENPIVTDSFKWDEANGRVVVKTKKDHEIDIGQVINMSVTDARPVTFNGSGFASILSRKNIIYPMVNDPGQNTMLGVIDMPISMTKGYFNSTLVYRNKRFEVTP